MVRAVALAVALPVAVSAAFSIGLGLGCRWGVGGYGEPRTECPGPYLPLYSAAQRGSTNHDWVGRPLSGRGSNAQIDRWANLVKINLTFSPFISRYDLNLKYLSPCPITSQISA